MLKFSARSIKNLSAIHPNLVAVLKAAIIDSPVDFTIVTGVRTAAEQKALFAIGRRKIKGESIVTYKDGIHKKSNHQVKDDGFGYAVDIYPFFEGKVQVSGVEVSPNLIIIAAHIKKVSQKLGYKVVWGGDWKMKDLPHFELWY